MINIITIYSKCYLKMHTKKTLIFYALVDIKYLRWQKLLLFLYIRACLTHETILPAARRNVAPRMQKVSSVSATGQGALRVITDPFFKMVSK